jgi:hypothetical protein
MLLGDLPIAKTRKNAWDERLAACNESCHHREERRRKMAWYESWREEVQRLPPDLARAASRYMQRGREWRDVLCECSNGHCLEGEYWWATREIIKRHTENHLFADQILRWFERMYGTCRLMTGYMLAFHSQATEDRIEEAHQEILAMLKHAIEEERQKTQQSKMTG